MYNLDNKIKQLWRFVPDQPTYNCYENEPEPVNTDEAFANYWAENNYFS